MHDLIVYSIGLGALAGWQYAFIPLALLIAWWLYLRYIYVHPKDSG